LKRVSYVKPSRPTLRGCEIGVKTWKLFADTTALINTGYETSVPEILIPITIHTQRGLAPPRLGEHHH